MAIELHCTKGHVNATEAARILKERLSEIVGYELKLHVDFIEMDSKGYVLKLTALQGGDGVRATIGANTTRNFIAGTGGLLERLLAIAGEEVSDEVSDATFGIQFGEWEETPELEDRIHYMPGHFGNSFEVCWSGEMQRYLEDLALAGASGYGDWFDPNDMPDPYHPHVYHSSSMFLWNRKKEWLAISQRLGLDNLLVITPNIGFVDQMRPEWIGVRDHDKRVQGQVLCPSNPAAREVMMDNQRRLFLDLQSAGIHIDKVVFAPYDDGGCACAKCQPYYPVFLNLVNDVQHVLREFYPQLKGDICGWWTSAEEREQLQQFIEGPASDWFSSFQFSAAYDVFELPLNLRSMIGDRMSLGCFLHIGFSHDRRDVYTKTGVHSAAERIRSVIGSFTSQQCTGFMTYNESFGDHYNAFVASRLGWKKTADLYQIATFYGRLILGLRGPSLKKLVDVLLEMEFLDTSRAASWVNSLEQIKQNVHTHAEQPWAFEHILIKAQLQKLDFSIEQKLEKNPVGSNSKTGFSEMEQRLKLSERLYRHVYGFGVLRHILIPARMLPDWYNVYMLYVSDPKRKNEGLLQSGIMNAEA